MIAGKADYLDVESFKPGQDPEQYRDVFESLVQKHSDETQLILVDLKGGTPYNTALYLSQKYKLKIITGVNIPRLLSVLTTRNENTMIEQLVNA